MSVEHTESTQGRSLSNGAPSGPATPETDGQDQAASPVMERAEELADRLAERLSHFAGIFGFKLMQFAARAREEAEDIWAEAQHIRHKEHAPPS
jgi:hypothetical protein